MPKRLRVLAGDCTTVFEGTRSRTQRGFVVVVVKPDNTTLVHDADGYQPVAWLTRPDSVTVEGDADGFTVTARTDDRELRVVSNAPGSERAFPVTEAGVPVGDCPDCDGPLVRTGGAVACLACDAEYGLPSGATVTDRACEDCGLPLVRVERGDAFHVCLDPGCDPLAERVSERFDGVWDCPDCDGALGVRRAEGRVFLGCTTYPDCETTFSFPSGVVVGECDCGLPAFETATGRRCLDGTCDVWDRDGGKPDDDPAGGATDGGRTLDAFLADAPDAAAPGGADGDGFVDGECPRD